MLGHFFSMLPNIEFMLGHFSSMLAKISTIVAKILFLLDQFHLY